MSAPFRISRPTLVWVRRNADAPVPDVHFEVAPVVDGGVAGEVVPVLKVTWRGWAVSVDRRFETWFDVTHRHRRGVGRFGWAASRVGDVGPLLVCVWLLVRNRRRGLAASAVIAGQALVVNLGVKRLIGRERPDDAQMTSSLPSGHVATAVCAALLAPGGGVLAMTSAGAVCAAGRVARQRHWVSDTIAGAVVGAGVGYAFKRTLGRMGALAP